MSARERVFTSDGVEYVVIVSGPHDGQHFAYAYGPDDAPGDPAAVGWGATPEAAVEAARKAVTA